MEEKFPSASHRSKIRSENTEERKEEVRKLEKIVNGSVTRRPASTGRRFARTFFGETAKNALGYVGSEILLPALRDLAADALSQFFDKVILGDRAGSRRSSRFGGSSSNYTNYTRYSRDRDRDRDRDRRDRDRDRDDRDRHSWRRDSYSMDEVIVPSRAEALDVLEAMAKEIDKYDRISVAALYELVSDDIPTNHTDRVWGWTDIRSAKVVRLNNDRGFLLDLPPIERID